MFRFLKTKKMVISIDVSHVYKYPVEVVMKAHLSKYPTQKEKNVLGVQTVCHTRDLKSNTLYWRRIATCINVLPHLLRKARFLNEAEILLEEECWWRPKHSTFSVSSRNVTWSQYARLEESSTFRMHEKNPHWTAFEQTGSIEIHGVGSLGWMLEVFAKQFLHQGIKKSLAIMEEILQEKSPQNSRVLGNYGTVSGF